MDVWIVVLGEGLFLFKEDHGSKPTSLPAKFMTGSGGVCFGFYSNSL
jgi:hypothetical protein